MGTGYGLLQAYTVCSLLNVLPLLGSVLVLKGLFLQFSQKCIDKTCYFDRESDLLLCQEPITLSEQLPY